MVPGQTLPLEISKIVHGGYGLARVDGRVVFVPGVIPGEVVDGRITEVKKSHAFGEALALVQPSPHRVDHVWPEADIRRDPDSRVGGADFGHIDPSHQRALKGSPRPIRWHRVAEPCHPPRGCSGDAWPKGVSLPPRHPHRHSPPRPPRHPSTRCPPQLVAGDNPSSPGAKWQRGLVGKKGG
jgi:predicted RNA-binding protein with TRAM domain